MGDNNGGFGLSDVGGLRQRVWSEMEDRLTQWMQSIKLSVETKQEGTWETQEEAQRNAEKAVEAGKRDDAVDDAFFGIQQRAFGIAMEYVNVQQSPEDGAEPLKQATQEFVEELHNPSTQEALLLIVDEKYRDNIRERISEFGSLYWGIYDVTRGEPTEDAWFVLSMMAETQGKDVESVVEGSEEFDAEEAPEWALEPPEEPQDPHDQ